MPRQCRLEDDEFAALVLIRAALLDVRASSGKRELHTTGVPAVEDPADYNAHVNAVADLALSLAVLLDDDDAVDERARAIVRERLALWMTRDDARSAWVRAVLTDHDANAGLYGGRTIGSTS